MNKKVTRKAITKIATWEGVKTSEIRKEMERAIMEGYQNQETRHRWIEIFGENTIPSPEEFIATIREIGERAAEMTAAH